MNVGFIGLGHMGKAIATNLLKAGHQVHVWNRSPGPMQELAAAGAIALTTPAEAFRSEVVCSILADDAAVRSVLLSSGALDRAEKDLVHVNLATISIELVQELKAAHLARGIEYVAAPVFGRPEAAAAGQLQIAAAGSKRALERVAPLLAVIGQKTWPMGDDPIHANAVKLAGNFMIAAAIEAMGEGVALARGYGVDPATLIDMLTNTIFASPIYKNYGKQIVERRFEPAGFKLTLGLKDIRLALAAGEAARVPMPFASVLRDQFLDAAANGQSEKDWAAVAEVSSRRAGQKP